MINCKNCKWWEPNGIEQWGWCCYADELDAKIESDGAIATRNDFGCIEGELKKESEVKG